MSYYYPFGETVYPLVQQDRTPKKVFVLGVYASAVQLGYTRKDAWLCDLLPETRINSSQAKVIKEKYNPLIEQYRLNPVTIPSRPTAFCDQKRSEEILSELKESQAGLLVLLGDIPIKQFLEMEPGTH